IKLPNSLQTIEKYAFARCLSLDEISLPASIQKIGIQAFIGCISLRLVILPPKVEIENNAFDLCKNVVIKEIQK
ncbi:leucine-rich repeat protein, partial [Prevotella pallens]